ncbi:small gtp binding protein rab8 [Anaeramoeba flamelloides]|uniref:Small gtp binding protein rab8 n=1 Tax=Anaeramoeba flamelloides TaxID=1746091 RepID=A0AAV7Z0G0_9EUKA|nr:small gtp binding protein rab8 [Anaeramoeba flamelloides]KAJ6241544.1 small gtp binding protein rab8 [Anaeramoeba flamelloides]
MSRLVYEQKLKFLTLGDTAVGKTSLVLRFSDDEFEKNILPTIGIDFKVRTLIFQEKRVRIQVWDTAGQEKFKNITSAYYRGAQGIILTYSVSNRKSYEHVDYWIKNIENCSDCEIETILVANKTDLEKQREVSKEEGLKLANKYSIPYIETSAKSGKNVEEAFLKLAKKVLSKKNSNFTKKKSRFKSTSVSTSSLDSMITTPTTPVIIEENEKIDEREENKCCN